MRYQNVGVGITAIRPQGQSPVEARLMLGYQWRNEKTKQVNPQSLHLVNHKLSISNPLGAMAKVRLRYEVQKSNIGLVVGASVNYFALDNSGLDSTQQKTNVGWQVYLEGRKYLENNKGQFLYAKVGKGQSAMYDFTMNHHGYYPYNLVRGGFGIVQHISPRLFYECNLGAKYCFGSSEFNREYHDVSQIIGVMSVIDLNIHFGFYLNDRLVRLKHVGEDYFQGNK